MMVKKNCMIFCFAVVSIIAMPHACAVDDIASLDKKLAALAQSTASIDKKLNALGKNIEAEGMRPKKYTSQSPSILDQFLSKEFWGVFLALASVDMVDGWMQGIPRNPPPHKYYRSYGDNPGAFFNALLDLGLKPRVSTVFGSLLITSLMCLGDDPLVSPLVSFNVEDENARFVMRIFLAKLLLVGVTHVVNERICRNQPLLRANQEEAILVAIVSGLILLKRWAHYDFPQDITNKMSAIIKSCFYTNSDQKVAADADANQP